MSALKVLIVGETWITTSTHTKGFDSFITSSYGEGYSYLKTALEDGGAEVTVITNERAPIDFPDTVEKLAAYDVLVLSDIGANTLLLTPDTWKLARVAPNRLEVIRDYVMQGGGLVMVGGYLTFTGIDAKGFWKDTPVEPCLPVRLMATDDRSEQPQGISGTTVKADHPILAGVPEGWPAVLGYNRTTLAEGAELIATIGADHPFIAAADCGKGRSVVFTSDCSPHWCPEPFLAWEGYPVLWRNICAFAAGRS
ncbi:glutamine amidotransferase [Frigidibacter sp. MR17.24]|uniref:glutamine amidotransferase n=1 Tax=Frigidibacter sp. MR17.24 TaxID=3127345 RepID=UPI003012DFCE